MCDGRISGCQICNEIFWGGGRYAQNVRSGAVTRLLLHFDCRKVPRYQDISEYTIMFTIMNSVDNNHTVSHTIDY